MDTGSSTGMLHPPGRVQKPQIWSVCKNILNPIMALVCLQSWEADLAVRGMLLLSVTIKPGGSVKLLASIIKYTYILIQWFLLAQM